MASLTAKYNANSFSPTISAPLSCLRRLSMFLIVLCTSEASWKQNAWNGLNYNSILTFTKGWIKTNLFPFLYLFLFELLKYANNPTQKVLTVLSRSPSPQMLGSIGWQSRPSAWVQVGQWRRTSQWKVVWERLKKFRSHFSSFQIIYKAPS